MHARWRMPAQFVLRHPPDHLWRRVRTKAQIERWALRDLILQLLEAYVNGQFVPTKPPPPAPARAQDELIEWRFTCPYCKRAMVVDVTAAHVHGELQIHAVACPHCSIIVQRMLPSAPVAVR
jgi:hypothetical protein